MTKGSITMTFEEMGIKIEGAAAMIRGFQEIIRGIVTEETIDDLTSENLYITANTFFSKALKEMLSYKCFVIWSEADFVSVHILNTSEECRDMIESAERLFSEYPIEDTNNPELDKFKRLNRFAREISFDEFVELAGNEFENYNNYSVSECGLEYIFEDRTAIINARAEGRI